jgi:DNA primase
MSISVEDLLIKKDIGYTHKGNDYIIKCLSPGHEDRNPSLRVDKITGIFNCFSCAYKGNLFSYFDEKPNLNQIRRATLKNKIIQKRTEQVGVPLPKNQQPYVGTWRDISQDTYSYFEAFTSTNQEHSGRIVFPIKDATGKVVCLVGRSTVGAEPRYLNTPAKAKMPMFPTVTPFHGSIVLVEGIFDMLTLFDAGIKNCMCCFGVKTITKEKLTLLKISGVHKVYIMFDNDDAGQNAISTIQELCDSVGMQTSIIKYPGKDPGGLSKAQIQTLKKQLYG